MQQLTDYSKLEGLDLKYKEYNHHFETSDGLIVAINHMKPRISRVLWYADEDYSTGKYRTSDDIAPNKEALKNCFIQDNLRSFHSVFSDMERHPMKKLYITKGGQYIRDSKVRAIVADYDEEAYKYERELTPEEVKVLKETVDKDLEAYKTRLDRYWKRYSDKVHINTYWADR